MRIWVTRDEEHDGPLSTALRAAGLMAVLEPVIERHLVDSVTRDIDRLGPDDWLVLTSIFAIEAVPVQPAGIPRVAVVDEASRRVAQARGFHVELVSPGGNAKSLFEELRATTTCGRLCHPRSSQTSPPTPWAGVELTSPVLYETRPRRFDRAVIRRVEVISVTSPSAVGVIGVVQLPYATIGPTTSASLRRIGIEPWLEAPKRSFKFLADAIAARKHA